MVYPVLIPCSLLYETLSYLTRNGNTVFQTFYDLEKAFDSVEYYVLLKHLFSRGIDGKCWWLIQSYYERPNARVKVNDCLSCEFIIERDVRQGSVLSPSLFLLLIDSLLHRLMEANVGVSLEGIYVGTLAHVDDLSLTCNPHSSEKQALIIHEFLTENLNADKCELIVDSSGNHFDSTSVKLGSQTLKPTTASKCLGTWWTHNLTSTKSIAENICKGP